MKENIVGRQQRQRKINMHKKKQRGEILWAAALCSAVGEDLDVRKTRSE